LAPDSLQRAPTLPWREKLVLVGATAPPIAAQPTVAPDPNADLSIVGAALRGPQLHQRNRRGPRSRQVHFAVWQSICLYEPHGYVRLSKRGSSVSREVPMAKTAKPAPPNKGTIETRETFRHEVDDEDPEERAYSRWVKSGGMDRLVLPGSNKNPPVEPAMQVTQTGSADDEFDPVLDVMKERKLPMTRETYLGLSYGEPNPDLSAEEEAQLPRRFQLRKSD